jgi:hypothetical protein
MFKKMFLDIATESCKLANMMPVSYLSSRVKNFYQKSGLNTPPIRVGMKALVPRAREI